VAVIGEGIGITTISNTLQSYNDLEYPIVAGANNSFSNFKLLCFISAGSSALDNLTLNNVSVGIFTNEDCVFSVGGTGATNLTLNNSVFFSSWDVDAGVRSSVWNNDQISLIDDSNTSSEGMHAHAIDYENTSLIINGGIVTMTSTNTIGYYSPSDYGNGMVWCSTNNSFTNIMVRIYGTTFNHYTAAGANPIYPFSHIGTNVFGWYWDNNVLTYVNGTNVYQPYAHNVILPGSNVTITSTTNSVTGQVTNTISSSGSGGSQTPLTSDINGAGYSLTNVNNLILTGNISVGGTATMGNVTITNTTFEGPVTFPGPVTNLGTYYGTGTGIIGVLSTNIVTDSHVLTVGSAATNYTVNLRAGEIANELIINLANTNAYITFTGTNLADASRGVIFNAATDSVVSTITLNLSGYFTNANYSIYVTNGYKAFFTFYNEDTTGTNIDATDDGRESRAK
jgi:hypothetical protein